MIASKCPGQDTRYWTAEDIHEQPCPHCGEAIEFWKTDIRVRCPKCRQKAVNPRFNLGCAQWCSFAEKCLGAAATGKAPQPLREVLENELSRMAHGLPLQIKEIKAKMKRAEEECRKKEVNPLPVLAAVVTVGLSKLKRLNDENYYLDLLVKEHSFPVEAANDALALVKHLLHGQRSGKEEAHEIIEEIFSGE